ncbi:GGDEF domain-containing protein [Shewanella sp. 11B5]|jgi:diguanylate cyclase (GGDEF)-like protein|uniref:GGDEF domain-containing protein n=1 Tax=Shewanella TaxID=22 RepID=UPI000C7E7071|nr:MULTISPECIES: sensor domain-containing diguanylate cyclase [Shewanella]MBB1383045.1 sensor domain-containing diguanylate cyclase [Shewanella sp. SR41-2]PKI07642.1 GGDEF domain-containing protein [Shewanella sp. 11B5]RPA33733.1 sensor domain-containing diguanylate cyclase [Shewanella frigidimarina]|tara:strand:+ start:4317 stop:5300 length:984 start_codon:yes stop_codon:yes gene_type:complete
MLLAPIPDNEYTRLETLRGLNVLDTIAEERFDRITRLAKRLFSVSISVVSLIDSERQWFKSVQGLDICETRRDISFCGHAINQQHVLVVPDALKDERFADNPLVLAAPNIRFYAGYPLTMPNGVRVGTLCIIDDKPRSFSKDDEAALEDLGKIVAEELLSIQQNTLDALTGISNRRGFELLAHKAIAYGDRLGFETCLIFFDLDYFKAINDQFGHEEGDTALKTFAGLLIDSFRESDIIARFAGDEFVVMLSQSDEVSVNSVLQRFQQCINQHNLQSGKPYHLRYSKGVAHRQARQSLSLNDYLVKVDKAMFVDKEKHHQRTQIDVK